MQPVQAIAERACSPPIGPAAESPSNPSLPSASAVTSISQMEGGTPAGEALNSDARIITPKAICDSAAGPGIGEEPSSKEASPKTSEDNEQPDSRYGYCKHIARKPVDGCDLLLCAANRSTQVGFIDKDDYTGKAEIVPDRFWVRYDGTWRCSLSNCQDCYHYKKQEGRI